MILYKKMDITTVEKGIVAHGVNAQFVMGSGVALAIRNKWPMVYEKYMWHKDRKGVMVKEILGKVLFVRISDALMIANCFTQKYYGNKPNTRYASPSAVRTALETCVRECNSRMLDLYMPRIGCGLGGLKWDDDVQPIVEKISQKLDDKLMLYVCDL
jgi:O-acetyl-ADP-ribose deacetylase (regulator of RNase III)